MSKIKSIELIEFPFPVKNVGPAENGFDTVYVPNRTAQMMTLATRIETTDGVAGEYVGGAKRKRWLLDLEAQGAEPV